jgi:ribonuclease HIII
LLEGVIYKDNKEISDEERNLKIWIGTDESGKGDFFGPLVVAGFVMTREIESSSKELGIKDSKRLSSKQVQATARKLNELYNDHIEVVAPSVAKYNELYEKFKNLNSLLAWCHARVIDNLIQRWQQKNSTIDGVVSDQFGNEGLIRNALSSMKTVHLIQRPRGESNSAVAAASIIARDSFERRIAEIERETGMGIPFGAGQEVLEKAKEYVRKYGKENLSTIAKIHFKTFKQI